MKGVEDTKTLLFAEVKRTHPNLSDKEVEQIVAIQDQMAGVLFDMWLLHMKKASQEGAKI